jgi:ABC-type transport system involved in multi-copper enzyme maturation permease subunit
MDFLTQLWAIARNTALECLRQPVVLAVMVAGTLLVVMSIPFSGFTLMDDQRMFVDIALSTVFVAGTLLAAFLATSALGREIDNRTVLTVVSKPVGRPAFVWGKFLGVALALTACTLVLTLVLMLVEMHGTMPTVRTPYHLPVIALGCLAALGAVAGAAWANYMYGWSFPAAATGLALPLLGIAYLVCLLFDKDWTPLAPTAQFEGRLWLAVAMMWTGLMALAGIAVAVSTRFGQVVTLGVTFGAFLLGLMSDWLVGRRLKATADMLDRLAAEGTSGSALDANHLQYWGLKALYAAIPNFQVFWLSDAVQQKRDLPLDYLLPAAAYGALTVTAALCAATVLFQRRDVG